MSIFSKLKSQINVEAVNKAVQEGLKNDVEFKELPLGKYYMQVDSMELTESQAGNPMLKIVFKIIDGEYKNWKHTYFQSFKPETIESNLKNAIRMLNSLESGVDIETLDDVENELDNMMGAIEDQKLEYEIEILETKTGFKITKVREVFVG